MEQSLSSFWIWWTLTLALVCWQMAQVWRDARFSLEYPVIAGLMWGYFYVVLPYQLVRNQPGAVAPHILALAQFQALVAYASLLLGWRYGFRHATPVGEEERDRRGRSRRRLADGRAKDEQPTERFLPMSLPTSDGPLTPSLSPSFRAAGHSTPEAEGERVPSRRVRGWFTGARRGFVRGNLSPGRSVFGLRPETAGAAPALPASTGLFRLSRFGNRRSGSAPGEAAGWWPGRQPEVFDYGTLWNCGLVLMAVGLIGDYTFAASGRAFVGTSAYWYLLFNLSYPGLSLCVAVLVLSPRHRGTANLVLASALAVPIILKYLAGARRGPTFVAIIAVSFTYFLVRSRFPKPAQVFGVLGLAGTILLVQVASRTVVYDEGGTWKQAAKQITLKDALVERTKKTGDNEFFNQCLILEANRRTGLYQYGTTHLAMLVHWIPRAWWPGKPQRNQGFFPSAIPQANTESHSNLGVGGAWGAVADTSDNYWWFFPAFWAGIGWFFAWVYHRGVVQDKLQWKLHYVGIICASHWFIAQCLPEALVPGLFYQAAYYGAFRLARVPAPGRRRRASRPVAARFPAETVS